MLQNIGYSYVLPKASTLLLFSQYLTEFIDAPRSTFNLIYAFLIKMLVADVLSTALSEAIAEILNIRIGRRVIIIPATLSPGLTSIGLSSTPVDVLGPFQRRSGLSFVSERKRRKIPD